MNDSQTDQSFTDRVGIPTSDAADRLAAGLRSSTRLFRYQAQAEREYWAEITSVPDLEAHFVAPNLLLHMVRDTGTTYDFYRVTDRYVVGVIIAPDGSRRPLACGRDEFTLYLQEVLDRAYNTPEIVKREYALEHPDGSR